MVLAAPPIASAIDALSSEDPQPRLLMPTPQGRRLDHQYVSELAQESHLAFICGHYEGIDERIVDLYHPEEFSIGDFVVSGGELPTLLAIDAVVRLQPGALGDADSAVEDSFAGDDNLLDHPCYTKPRELMDQGAQCPAGWGPCGHRGLETRRAPSSNQRTPSRPVALVYVEGLARRSDMTRTVSDIGSSGQYAAI